MALLLLPVAHLPAAPTAHQHQHSHVSVKPLLTHSEYHKAHKLGNSTQQKLNRLRGGYKRQDGEQEWSYKLHSQKRSRECPILERRAFPRQHSHKDWCFTAHQEHPFKDITPQWSPYTNGHPNTTFSSASDGNCSIYILLLHRVYWTKSMATHKLLNK